jgi:hypothetical protein
LCVLLLGTAVGCGTSRSAAGSTPETTATATATQTALPTTGETATGTPPTGTETTTNPAAPQTNGAPPTNARLPATYTILRGGSLSPPTITVPAQIPVQVTVISGDGRSHRVLLRTPTTYVLAVPAHGRAGVLITGPKTGRYPLDVDGTARGLLVIGGAPGP